MARETISTASRVSGSERQLDHRCKVNNAHDELIDAEGSPSSATTGWSDDSAAGVMEGQLVLRN